ARGQEVEFGEESVPVAVQQWHEAIMPRRSDKLDRSTQRQRGGRERLGLLTPEAPGLTRGLDSGLFDVGDGALEVVGVLRTDGDEAGGAEDAVAGGEVGFLLEDVAVLGGLLGVLDLADALSLGGVGDVLG